MKLLTILLFVFTNRQILKAASSENVLFSCDISVAPQFYPDGEPQDTVVNLMQTKDDKINVMLTCRAYGCPLPQYTWFRDGNDITNLSTQVKDGEFGFKVSAGNGVSQHGVKYYCVATSYFNGKPAAIRSQEALVTFAYTEYVITTPTVSNILAMAGGSLYLKCKMPTSNPPVKVVTWIDGFGSEILNDDDTTIYDEGGKYLFIQAIDNAFFTRNNIFCKLSNATGPSFLSRVGYRVVNDLRFRELDVYDHEDNFFGLIGENITFRYVAHFKGSQSYTGPGVQLHCNHSRIVFQYSLLAEVTLTVPQADSSNYIIDFSCAQHSINENRLDPVAFRLTALKLPAVVSSSPDEDLVVRHESEDSLILTCNGSALPPPTIVWYYNGKILSRSTEGIRIDGMNLQILRLSSSYFGIFQCAVVTDHNGKTHVANRMWFLRIIEKPKDEYPLEVRLGVTVLIMFITPSLTWTILFIIFNSIQVGLCCSHCCRSKPNEYPDVHHDDNASLAERSYHHSSSGQMMESDYDDDYGRIDYRKKRRRSLASTRS